MANFDIAFAWLMQSEDPKGTFETIPDAPPGAYAIGGVNSHSFPTAFRCISALPPTARKSEVYRFYRDYFWNSGWFAQLDSDEVAKRVFDAAVNMGSVTAVKLFQKALGIDRDGIWGPDILRAANEMPPDTLINAFKEVRKEHYLAIGNEKYMKGWLARCER